VFVHHCVAPPTTVLTSQTLATLAADPLASLVDTAWLGHLGTIQLAGVRLLDTNSHAS